MSRFSVAWLALREGADAEARAPLQLMHVEQMLNRRENVRVVDLGCGAGSMVRSLAKHLPRRQRWLLVDRDEDLLERAVVAAQAESATVVPHHVDLPTIDLGVFCAGADLVIASALLDLVSEAFLTRLAAALDPKALFYAPLTFSGEMRLHPVDPLDAAIRNAFITHQHGDKGFGAALGPDACAVAARILRASGRRVLHESSPWRLDHRHADLLSAVLDGIAQAVRQTALVDADEITAWQRRRDHQIAEGRLLGFVGHQDLLALPVEAG